ncbi:MAG: alpha/beta hydrolase, partial [Gammaproteobacteria bacterium]
MDGVLSWVWPPALLALVVWMAVQAHRQLRSRSRRWLLYPVIGMLAVAAVGGGYETVSAAT